MDKRLQKEINGPKWAALAPLIGGASSNMGMEGQYQGHSVRGHQRYEMGGANRVAATQLWRYTLTLRPLAHAHGKGETFEVHLEDDGIQASDGDENAVRQLLNACGPLNFQEMGLNGLRFNRSKEVRTNGPTFIWRSTRLLVPTTMSSPQISPCPTKALFPHLSSFNSNSMPCC